MSQQRKQGKTRNSRSTLTNQGIEQSGEIFDFASLAFRTIDTLPDVDTHLSRQHSSSHFAQVTKKKKTSTKRSRESALSSSTINGDDTLRSTATGASKKKGVAAKQKVVVTDDVFDFLTLGDCSSSSTVDRVSSTPLLCASSLSPIDSKEEKIYMYGLPCENKEYPADHEKKRHLCSANAPLLSSSVSFVSSASSLTSTRSTILTAISTPSVEAEAAVAAAPPPPPRLETNLSLINSHDPQQPQPAKRKRVKYDAPGQLRGDEDLPKIRGSGRHGNISNRDAIFFHAGAIPVTRDARYLGRRTLGEHATIRFAVRFRDRIQPTSTTINK